MSKRIGVPEDLSKLPVWARNKIRHLTEEVARLQESIVKTIEGDSDVLYSNGLEDRGLPKGSAIKFLLPFGRGQVNKVEIKVEGHHLHVYAWEQIAIHPASSNVFTIHTKPHRLP